MVIITGASRGYGRALALAFARRLKTPLHLVLAARSFADLEETQNLVLQLRAERDPFCPC
jgi:NAD(P)-dependent dehydrogenase (short-subunit alcohol dehydrogenase family)